MARPETKQKFKCTNEVANHNNKKSHLILLRIKPITNRKLAAMHFTCLNSSSIPGSLSLCCLFKNKGGKGDSARVRALLETNWKSLLQSLIWFIRILRCNVNSRCDKHSFMSIGPLFKGSRGSGNCVVSVLQLLLLGLTYKQLLIF